MQLCPSLPQHSGRLCCALHTSHDILVVASPVLLQLLPSVSAELSVFIFLLSNPVTGCLLQQVASARSRKTYHEQRRSAPGAPRVMPAHNHASNHQMLQPPHAVPTCQLEINQSWRNLHGILSRRPRIFCESLE